MIENKKLAEQTLGPKVRSAYQRIHRLEHAFLMSGQFTDLLRLRQARDQLPLLENQYVDETERMWDEHRKARLADEAIAAANAAIARIEG